MTETEKAEGITSKLSRIQSRLKAPKDQKSNNYNYRNIEDINEAVKPLAAEEGCAVVYSDTIVSVDGRLAMLSECRLCDDADAVSATGLALLTLNPKFMSIEQQTGAASSYARKYAACGLFAIDSSADDPDAKPVEASTPRQALIEYAYGHYADHGHTDAKAFMAELSKREGFDAYDEVYVSRLIASLAQEASNRTDDKEKQA